MNSGGFSYPKQSFVIFATMLFVSVVTSARAQSASLDNFNADMAMDSTPLIISVGAIVFAVISVFWLLRVKKTNIKTTEAGQDQVAQMRAELDEYEALLSCMPEVTLLWLHSNNPQIFGKTDIFGTKDMGLVQLLNYKGWLLPTDADKLATGVKYLHLRGEEFSISVHTKSGQLVRAVGRVTGHAKIVRLRNATALPPVSSSGYEQNASLSLADDCAVGAMDNDLQSVKTVLSMLQKPAWICNLQGDIVFANQAYMVVCEGLNIAQDSDQFPMLFTAKQTKQHISTLLRDKQSIQISNPLPDLLSEVKLVLSLSNDSIIGIIAPLENQEVSKNTNASPALSTLGQVIGAITNPMVVFDQEGRLTQFNAAYVSLFNFDKSWLTPGLNEREILDYLRRTELLPTVANYRKWRTMHLRSYKLDKPRHDEWHLPDGRTLEIVATPDTGAKGVIYTFCDITEQLRLQSTNKAMLNVQRETLNALSEAVAVFGTDGRLRLHNPKLSSIWKIPMNELGQNPHIDQIAEACGKSIPEEGEEIWQKLKPSVIDLNPGRTDKAGRIQRRDGLLIDYAIVRLADSQTMLTFVDVTQSANYENVLKERNDALVTADRLKDAFVQNVSYELRSPLTSIIGFADLLASDDVGPLTEQQRAYTDYIRSSSATLGVLIDNILDLTNVDAGIAQLDLQEQDISALIKKARAGFSATLVKSDGSSPINLVVSISDPQPKFVADGARVVQILYNLISNAAKFSEPGAQIRLNVEQNKDWVRFTIQDEGVNIPSHVQQVIASSDPKHSLKGLQRGSGIGLAIVKAFVELHRGTISMQSNTGGGSEIIVNLPADPSKLINQTQSG